jgi:hypothetical protein
MLNGNPNQRVNVTFHELEAVLRTHLPATARKRRQRVLRAHQAISQRLQALSQDHFGTREEREAIADALNGLAMLERELQGTRSGKLE